MKVWVTADYEGRCTHRVQFSWEEEFLHRGNHMDMDIPSFIFVIPGVWEKRTSEPLAEFSAFQLPEKMSLCFVVALVCDTTMINLFF